MFKSTVALKRALVATGQVQEADLKKVILGNGESMFVDVNKPTVALGYVTKTFLGVFPGHGKKYAVTARFA